jgi:hypothetical protein
MLAHVSFIPERAKNIYRWLNWIIETNQPVRFCESTSTRKYTSLAPVSSKTIVKYMVLLGELMVDKLKNELKNRIIGLLFDGWSEDGNHFVGVFACYEGSCDKAILRLLAVAPLLDETDFGAASHIEFLRFTLSHYDLTLDTISFIVADNCNCNKSIAELLKKPMIGCASHRLNLGVKNYYAEHEALLGKVNALMYKLNTLKNAGRLRRITHLSGRRRNFTRWSSTFLMLKRYSELRDLPLRNQVLIDDNDETLVPTRQEDEKLMNLLKDLEDLESVNKFLQNETGVSLLEVRQIFDYTISKYQKLESHLSTKAKIVKSKDFENAIVKVLGGQEILLSADEAKNIECFLKSVLQETVQDESAENMEHLSFVERARLTKKPRIDPTSSKYVNLKWIPSTTNAVERFFSRLKLVFSSRRKSLLPKHLELILKLVVNHDLWSLEDVSYIYTGQSENLQSQDDDIHAADLTSDEEFEGKEAAVDIDQTSA